MNNPLEAVTQAVNSLLTALKLPDESAKANEVLGEMSFPQFSRLLPYRDYNQESGLFMNDTTMGFMLEAIPINGANESIVEALDHMLRTKLPRGIPLCIHLMSSQLVGDRIEYGLREFSWSGEQAERFNAITRAYYMKAAATQFPLPEGMNLPLTLRHYRVFISYCSPSKKKSRADILEMENLVKIIRASLQGASITTQTVDAQAFIDIVGEMINHNPDSLYPKRRQLDPYSDLNYQCVEDSFDLKVRADYLTLGLRENGRNSTARILNFHLARNPEIAFLWNMADNYSNLLNPELSISCPFILTLTLVVEDQVKTHSEANLKYMDLEKKSKTSYAKWFPSVEKEAKEWGELRQRLGSGQSSVVSYFLNITAFCKDNNETALEVEQDILNSFRKNGFELISPRFNHMRNFLTCLPFMAGKGLFKQLKEAGVVQRAESFNVANLMPLVADNPLTPAGLLAPTYRNQLAFIDIFFRGMNNTNYNMAVCGTSGAGKTGLIQPLIRSVLDSGGFAVVFDMGDGYKSLCENMGGVYLDGETLRFNPFANITDIDQSAERVRDQLSVMASRMRSAVESYAKAHNISNEQATQELASRSTRASAGMYGDAHAEWGIKPKILGVGGGAGVRGGGRAGIDWSDDDAHQASSGSRASHDARHDIDARATQDFKEASDYFTSRKVSESGSHTDNNADSRVDQLSAALNSAKQSYDQYTTNMTRSHEYAEMASRTESMSGQMSEDLSQQFAQYVMKHAPQDAEAILTNTSSPEIAERRRAMAWSFVQEQVQPGVDNAWRESRGDIGKGMESVPSGGGSQDIIADHQGHQGIIEQRTQDSNIRNDVKQQVDNMVTEYRGNIGDTQNSILGEENIVRGQYSELQNHHKTEVLSQDNKYNEEKSAQERMPGADSPQELMKRAKVYQDKHKQ
ncbi:type IV secretion system protein TraC [Escherichia coli]|uniref:type IV secretion system protein TraC n=3 Tax=Escherichia coli TaxID=562 RepID=UPI00181834CB|nr:type IV secretion system protein TraC [Escherichia coli]EEX9411828.1 type IV secretion system protein TraC [Escherichia coli]EFG5284477.1 type IV secretion system protein TraC [Escherichia coli]EFI6860594.1 type IV secretion system protein TraC [Escherichia coli]EFK6940778.1 type IV secretion system protein TraC [Escherichia coli]